MARLTRVRQKVFASNASNNGVFGSLQAGNPTTSSDVATLQSLSAFENGWDDAIEQGDKLPPLEEFQGLQYGISYQQAYILQEGVPEWDANTPYYKGSLAKTISGSSFKLYCSLADNNTGNVVTNTTYWAKVMDSDDLYAYDSAVVHNTGNETIAGNKTFSGEITFTYNFLSKGSWTAGTTPSSNQYTGYNITDSQGTNVASFVKYYGSNGDFYTRIYGTKVDGSGGISISIGYDRNGNARAIAPIPDTTTDTSSDQIATTGWVNSSGNNVTHLSGAETISGNKSFTGQNTFSPLQIFKSTSVNGTIFQPSSPSGNNSVSFVNNGTNFYMIPCDATGTLTSARPFYFNIDGSSAYSVPSDGVNSILVTSAISKADNGYVKLGNGIIIQWGAVSGSTSTFHTVTLPTAFTNKNYQVAAIVRGTSTFESSAVLRAENTQTTTSFDIAWPNSSGVEWIAIGW